MTVTLDLPPQVEQAYLAEAASRGVPLDALVLEVLIAQQPTKLPENIHPTRTIFERGLGLFGSPQDAALMDEVVAIAYEERKRPSAP